MSSSCAFRSALTKLRPLEYQASEDPDRALVMPRTKRTLGKSDGNTSFASKRRRASNGQTTSKDNTAPAEENTPDIGNSNSCAIASYELRCVIVACIYSMAHHLGKLNARLVYQKGLQGMSIN